MLHPADITDHFYFRLTQAGLLQIGLHGQRHGAATINLAAGVDMRVVQEPACGECAEQYAARRDAPQVKAREPE